MIVMFRMTPEKKEKMSKKIDKMMDFLDEFKTCIEEGEEYDEDELDEEPSYRRRNGGSSGSMRGRYSYRRGGM